MVNIHLTETEDWPSVSGIQIYRADFRSLSLKEIEDLTQKDLQSYLDVGYNSFMFNRTLATIFIRKIEVKTLQDVFDTDIYKIL